MKRIFSITILLAVVLGTTSCKKWLDLKPQDGIVGDEFWQTKEQVEAGVIGIYSSLLTETSGNSIGPVEAFFLWGEARADMVVPGFRASAEELDIVNMNIQPNNRFTNWR